MLGMLSMKNLLPYQYTLWLQKFKTTYESNTTATQLSKRLIEELSTVETIEELDSVITSYIPKEADHLYAPVSFYEQLSQWHKSLEALKANIDRVIALLAVLEITDENAPLLMFLTEIITDKKAQLNCRMNSLLSSILNSDPSKLIHYISNLPTATYPSNPRPGEFAAIQPVTENHHACLIILNNLATAYNDTNSLWVNGNTLLQSSLLIHSDLQNDISYWNKICVLI